MRLSSLRTRLTLLVLLSIVPSMGLILWNGLAMRRLAREDAHKEAFRLARIIRDQQAVLLQVFDHVLKVVSLVPVVERCEGPECGAFLSSLLADLPQFAALVVARADGNVACSSTPLSEPVTLADRDYFRRALATRAFSTGAYVVGRVSGEASLPCARPLLSSAGQVDAVVVAGLRLTWLAGLVKQAQLPEGSQVTLLDPNGTILARYPDPGSWVGRSAAETELARSVLNEGERLREIPGLDGFQRLYAFVRIQHQDQTAGHVAVGIPSAAAYAESRKVLFRHLLLGGAVTLSALALCWAVGGVLVVRPAKALAEAVRALEQGDLTARSRASTAPGELGILADSFDRMAEKLQRRQEEREAAHLAIQRQERFLRSVIESLSHPFLVINVADHSVALANPAAGAKGPVTCHALSHGLDEPCDGSEHGCPLETVVRERRSVTLEHRHLGPGGESRHVEVHAYPLFDEDGSINQVIHYSLDVTDTRKAQEDLKQREATLRALVENTGDLIWSVDREYRILTANSHFRSQVEAATGSRIEDGEIVLRESYPATVLREWKSLYDRALAGEAFTYETESPSRGETRSRENAFNPILGTGGAVLGVAVISREVTERKRTVEDLRRANRALRTLTAVQRAVWETSEEEDLLRRACEAVVGEAGFRMAWIAYPRQDEGRTIYPAAWHGLEDGFLQNLNSTWADDELGRDPTGTAIESGRVVVCRDIATDERFGPWRAEALRLGYGSNLALPLRVEGHVAGALSIYSAGTGAFDAPEVQLLSELASVLSHGIEARRTEAALRQSEEQLRQAQRLEAVGRLAGGVAHDFNNLLQVILGRSEILLEDRDPAPDRIRETLHEIRNCADRAARLTRQLLAFSRKQVLEPRVLDPNAVISEMEKMLRRLIGEDVEFVTHLEPQVGLIKADPGQLEQVLVNLAVNARDAMPQGGKLTIESANVFLDHGYARSHPGVTPGPHVMIGVSDTGCGMDKITLQRIFEPFFTTKERGKGTGLGLATVYGIVKQSGGNIWVYSEPGKGAAFKVYLPLTEGVPEGQRRAAEPALCGTQTILLVEDEPPVRRAIRAMLEEGGYTVLEAENPAAALALARGHPGHIDLLLTDVVMPGMGGRDLGNEIRLLRPSLSVLFMSGYLDNAIVHHGVLDAGVVFLQKPFTRSGLLAKIREALVSGEAFGT
ncbi:MAG: PAS domain-containing protein [Deltaproteobacteria bacterium]|nr:PAS domain-containing protein [Deltaproteobacteria bacterium]